MEKSDITVKQPAREGYTVYELGFHIVSSVPEEAVAGEFSALKAAIEKHGGEFIAEDAPKMRSLAYEITKKIEGKNQRFGTAYFGWIKFEMTPTEIVALKTELDLNSKILRYLLIVTVREDTLAAPRQNLKNQRSPGGTSTDKPESPVSVEELDKSIDNLVVQ